MTFCSSDRFLISSHTLFRHGECSCRHISVVPLTIGSLVRHFLALPVGLNIYSASELLQRCTFRIVSEDVDERVLAMTDDQDELDLKAIDSWARSAIGIDQVGTATPTFMDNYTSVPVTIPVRPVSEGTWSDDPVEIILREDHVSLPIRRQLQLRIRQRSVAYRCTRQLTAGNTKLPNEFDETFLLLRARVYAEEQFVQLEGEVMSLDGSLKSSVKLTVPFCNEFCTPANVEASYLQASLTFDSACVVIPSHFVCLFVELQEAQLRIGQAACECSQLIVGQDGVVTLQLRADR